MIQVHLCVWYDYLQVLFGVVYDTVSILYRPMSILFYLLECVLSCIRPLAQVNTICKLSCRCRVFVTSIGLEDSNIVMFNLIVIWKLEFLVSSKSRTIKSPFKPRCLDGWWWKPWFTMWCQMNEAAHIGKNKKYNCSLILEEQNSFQSVESEVVTVKH